MNFKAHFYNHAIWYFLFILFLFFVILSYFAEATADSGDGIRHYLISRYSWKHPYLLLDSWGKPFFTLCSSPFSQFGLMGMNIFNILCGIGSAFFAYKIARLLKLNYDILVVVFLLFTPIYFFTLNSGLTEPFFGFVLIASIYLFFKERYVWGSILISFIPHVRTEGYLILPLFFLILLLRKKYLTVPLLSLGTILYSIVGFFYYGDFLWIINQNPYTGSNRDFYGSGKLLDFVTSYATIWGFVLTILFAVGIVKILQVFIQAGKQKNYLESKLPEELILIIGSFALYFIAHSIMWWKGMANSLGLLRVLAAVIPCSALICLRGLNLLMIPFFRRKKHIEFLIIAVLLFLIIRSPFIQYYFPYKLDPEQALMKKTADWFVESPYTQQKIYYIHPVFAHFININPFDKMRVAELWSFYSDIEQYGIGAMPDSTIIIWDSHFGPHECGIPLDTLLHDKNFRMIKAFKPDDIATTFDGKMFEVYVFVRHRQHKAPDTLAYDFFDLESIYPNLKNYNNLVDDIAYSGKYASKLSAENEYSVIIEKNISEIPQDVIKFEIKYKLLNVNANSGEAVTVVSIEDKQGNNLFWVGEPIFINNQELNVWQSVSMELFISIDEFPSDAVVKTYVWNNSKKDFYIDNFEIIYLGYR